MNKEALREITEFAEMLYNFREAMTIETIENNIESFLLANHYRKLPKGKPPLLGDEEIQKGWVKAEFEDTENGVMCNEIYDLRKILQTQRDICIKHYEG